MKTIYTFSLMLIAASTYAQELGNAAYTNYNDYNYRQYTPIAGANKLYLSDSTFKVDANIMMNVLADTYVATFGVAESDKVLKVANLRIDERIAKFVSALNKMGIADKDLYIDKTTQTLIADYNITGDYAEQFVSGFEQKKNVIVKFNNIKDLEKMVAAAADYGIYDLVKVDYIVTDINKVYTQLFKAAMEIINNKKELYASATNVKLKASSEILAEGFTSYEPVQLYKHYTPKITSEFYYNHSFGKRKDLRPNTTFYYDKISSSGFDKVINPVVVEPAVEFVFNLSIKFEIVKDGK